MSNLNAAYNAKQANFVPKKTPYKKKKYSELSEEDKNKSRKSSARWKKKNKEKFKKYIEEYRKSNIGKVREWGRNHWHLKVSRMTEEQKGDLARKHSIYYKKWAESNRDHLRKKRREYYLIPGNRIIKNIRTRLNAYVRGLDNSVSLTKLIGCTREELRQHLESKFKEGMTWENYGVFGWHIDHIKPLTAFDVSNKMELEEAINYKNLQPLWAKDNLKKGKSY